MATAESATTTQETDQKVNLPTLTAMVVGSMVGSGVFLLPRRFGTETGVFGALIAWAIAGTGMLMLAFVFQRLAVRKPSLDAGIFAYAKAGFGDYVGFNSAFGFWASACAGNTSYWVLIMATISALFPALGDGTTVLAVVLSSIGLWLFFWMISRGVQQAAIINRIATIAKVVPILVFIVLALVLFNGGYFSDNFWGGNGIEVGSLWTQVKGTMLITVFVFLGIEGASMYSRFAKRREDVGRATVLGFLGVLGVFALVTLVSYGAMPQGELAAIDQPSMASVLKSLVGEWGSVFIRIGVILSVLGAYLAWTLMAAEVLFVPARSNDMPKFLARENKSGAPVPALLFATGLVQILLILIIFVDDGLDFMLDLTAALALLPYLFAAAYLLKLTFTGETYREPGADGGARRKDLVIAAIAVVYTGFLVWAAGLDKLLLSCILYALGTILYVIARRERNLPVFRRAEAVLFVALIAGAIGGIIYLATDSEDIFEHPDHERHSYYVNDPADHHHPDGLKGTS
ncbi:basic amino acid/polyamine antiporter [Gordonia jinhuaensis]|uniref:Amino acid APC transporter n=1 Tax=Gordonia jinhuaensis TaxID=1517702 RepID=A0A916TEI1_9ACTN|nr:basic amino acid/polyamine antiporter [Gordonia jinhuaensis]GGB41841.1 amino acid APC transporter [Gordonia jinhuaensis]